MDVFRIMVGVFDGFKVIKQSTEDVTARVTTITDTGHEDRLSIILIICAQRADLGWTKRWMKPLRFSDRFSLGFDSPT